MTIRLKGGPELLRLLDELPKNLERNVIRSGLRAGAKVIQQQAKANVPVRTGKLKKAIEAGATVFMLTLCETLAPDRMQRAGQRDVVDVMAGGLRHRTVLAPAGHAAVDEAWVAAQDLLGPEADEEVHFERSADVALEQLPRRQPRHPPQQLAFHTAEPERFVLSVNRLDRAKRIDLLMWELWFGDLAQGDQFTPMIHAAAEHSRKEGVVVRHMRKRDMEAEVTRFMGVYNVAWGRNWGFVPITVMMPFLIWRLFDEERLLARNLPGYTEYQEKVRHRLVPFVW